MDQSLGSLQIEEPSQARRAPRKPRVLLAACGSIAAMKFGNLCYCFLEWAEVKVVATEAALRFIDRNALPADVVLHTEEYDWCTSNKLGDPVVHIELRKWADILVIAPLSANTLAKIASGLCDNLLTCIVRAWDYSKPVFIAPSMNPCMWSNPFTEKHMMEVDELGMSLIPPVSHRSSDGEEVVTGAMAEPSDIYISVRRYYQRNP